jgi:hypothetical protein
VPGKYTEPAKPAPVADAEPGPAPEPEPELVDERQAAELDDVDEEPGAGLRLAAQLLGVRRS